MDADTTPTIRERRLSRTGAVLLAVALLCGAARVATQDTSLNSLLIIGAGAAVLGTIALLRAGRHI